jgi:5-(carboxyamino)imidazole ribonucleotide mutase
MTPQVLILIGSESDRATMEKTVKTLGEFGITSQLEVASAHRTPTKVATLVREGEKNGVKVFIAAAGMAAHLGGAVAANTIRPVIGVPLAGSALNGMDSLLSTVQMPKGIPVATVAIGDHGAINAGFLAAQIIALGDPAVAAKLRERRENH